MRKRLLKPVIMLLLLLLPQVTLASGINPEFLVTNQAIGFVRMGMSYTAFKEAIGKNTLSPFKEIAVETWGLEVMGEGRVLYAVSFDNDDQPPLVTSKVIFFMTSNPLFRTVENIGPGTRVMEAERVYGQARLNYSTNDESREYVSFKDFLYNKEISFRVALKNSDDFAGIYTRNEGESDDYFETMQYNKEARIEAIWVNNLSGM